MAPEFGGGARSRLPTAVLLTAGLSTVVAVIVSAMSILLQLRNYRRPALQRMVIRIMVMVPIYAVSSLISLFSVEAAFVIDAIRDIYEAFVIYCFFVLLLSYLGGERSLLILLHGRPPKEPVFPINIFKHEIDVSDPYTFLFLKRGIFQYVQVKPILAAMTLILKALGKYNDGNFRANSGYLYISIIYNTSICLSLYCLAMFWVCVNDDLKPFRPVPKFLCVKGILFFSFWQSVAISVLVAAEVITKLGPYTDPEDVSVGLNDTLICLEMPFFAIAHMYAFSYKDYVNSDHSFVARMPMYYAFRDAFGILDVIEDSRATLRGERMDYREFEPAEGLIHQGAGRDRRIRAGLRYSKGGQRKYWLPKATNDTQPHGRAERLVNNVITKIAGEDQGEEVHAPLLTRDADDVVHLAPDMQESEDEMTVWEDPHGEGDRNEGYELPFGDLDENDEELFAYSKQFLFGDYNYPCIDVSTESARTVIWDEEERVLRNERGAWFSPIRGAQGQAALRRREAPAWQGYGAVSTTQPVHGKSHQDSGSNGFGHHVTKKDDKLIDYEQDRMADPQPNEVLMKWTKASGSRATKAVSKSQSPRIRTLSRTSSNSPSPSGSHSRPNADHRHSSISISKRSSSRTSPVLPPDAVDLVVEDYETEEERSRGRLKIDTDVTRPGLRKVYRRGFVAEAEPGQLEEGEVEVEEAEDRRMDVGEEIIDNIEDRHSPHGTNNENDSGKDGWGHVGENVVATAGTPPPHAQVSSHKYDIPEDNNPWA